MNTQSLGEQLDEIMRDMDAAYAAKRAAKAGFDSPEADAIEAVYVRLRAFNEQVAGR